MTRGIERYLTEAENHLHTVRKHWVVLVRPVLVWIVGVGAAVLLSLFLTIAANAADIAGGVIAVVFTLFLAWRVLQWWLSRYVITDRRVLLIEGVLSIKVTSISFAKVTDTTFSRPLMGRILGYGDIMLDSAGETPGVSTLHHLPGANNFYREISQMLTGGGTRSAPDDTDEIPPVKA